MYPLKPIPIYSAWLNANMRSQVLQIFGIMLMESSPEGNKPHPRTPAITNIDRGPPLVPRRNIRQDLLAAAAAKNGRVQVVRLQDMCAADLAKSCFPQKLLRCLVSNSRGAFDLSMATVSCLV